MDARRDAFSAGAGVANCTPLFAAVWREEFDAVRELLRGGADPFRGDSEGRTPISLVNRGSDAHTENTRRIREILDRYLDAAEAKPEMLDAARASCTNVERRPRGARRSGSRRGRDARRRTRRRCGASRGELVALNTELDALKVASEAARAAQQASALAEMPRKNVKGAANAAAGPYAPAGEVAALVAAADERRDAVRSALDALKRDVITADDLAADRGSAERSTERPKVSHREAQFRRGSAPRRCLRRSNSRICGTAGTDEGCVARPRSPRRTGFESGERAARAHRLRRDAGGTETSESERRERWVGDSRR